MAAKKFLTFTETAEATGLSKRSVQRLVASQQLPVVRFGHSVRIPAAALDAMAMAAIRSTTTEPSCA